MRRLLARILLGPPPPPDPGPPVWPHLRMDPTSYGGHRVVFYPGDPPNEVRIGRYCSIAVGVRFMIGGNHRPDWASTYPFRYRLGLAGAGADGHPASRGPIQVGNDVWIGESAVILSGVTIGDGAVVGTEAVVAHDVRPYAVVVGNPAREVRRRFGDEEVDALLGLRWWDWPAEEIREIVPLLNGAPVGELIAYGRARDAAA
jgi:acetyltransferase-like isoleucine patch superfamily enzyme